MAGMARRDYGSLYRYSNATCSDPMQEALPDLKTAAEMRKWIMCIEANRRLTDLADVNYDNPPSEGDLLIYNGASQQWEIVQDNIVFFGGDF